MPREGSSRRVAALYDQWTPTFVRFAGMTHQAALLPGPKARDLGPCEASNRSLVRRLSVRSGQTVLDAGAGVGGPAMCLAEQAGVRVTAVSIAAEQVALGRLLTGEAGFEQEIDWVQGDYHELPLPDLSFDGAWMLESACYADPPLRLLQELHRVLKPGAPLLIKDLFLRPGPHDAAAQAALAGIRDSWRLPPLHTVEDWAEAMRLAGFAVPQVERPEVETDTYLGSMFELDPARGLVLNPFGRAFYADHSVLPIEWAVLTTRAGAA